MQYLLTDEEFQRATSRPTHEALNLSGQLADRYCFQRDCLHETVAKLLTIEQQITFYQSYKETRLSEAAKYPEGSQIRAHFLKPDLEDTGAISLEVRSAIYHQSRQQKKG